MVKTIEGVNVGETRATGRHSGPSPLLFGHAHLTNHNRNEKQQGEQQPLRTLAFLYPLKSPQNSKQELPPAGRITPLPEHQTKHR